jgi:hypothetical protein
LTRSGGSGTHLGIASRYTSPLRTTASARPTRAQHLDPVLAHAVQLQLGRGDIGETTIARSRAAYAARALARRIGIWADRCSRTPRPAVSRRCHPGAEHFPVVIGKVAKLSLGPDAPFLIGEQHQQIETPGRARVIVWGHDHLDHQHPLLSGMRQRLAALPAARSSRTSHRSETPAVRSTGCALATTCGWSTRIPCSDESEPCPN